MLNKFLTNIIDINSILDGNEIKIYNKEDVSKFGIMVDSVIVTGESKSYIPEIIKPFGITAIKLLKQLLSNKDIKDSGIFELVKENNQFTNQEEIAVLKISNNNLTAEIRLASEDVLQKIPVSKNIEYNISCKDIEKDNITKLQKNVELLENNDEYFTIEVKPEINLMKFISGKTGQTKISIDCPFTCNSSEYTANVKYTCKSLLTGLKIASKFDKADIKINNKGLFTIVCENDFIKLNINIRGSIIETAI